MAIVVLCGCKRTHDAPAYESDNARVAAVPVVNAPAEDLAGVANPLHEPTLAPKSTARMPDGGTINGDPRGPRAAEFNRVLDGALKQLPSCFAGPEVPAGDLAIKVHYVVEQPGYTGGVTATGNAPKAALECARGIVEGLKFPQYRGPKVEQDLPFTLQKREKATRIEIWDAAPKPENP
ncbi:MAG: hypothetical protein JWN44_2242 [Myxococcales bacterium]|nr:hypothetical protein [Myxococcales bacterium]